MPEIVIEEAEPNHVHIDDDVVVYDGLPSADTVLEVHEGEDMGDSAEPAFSLPKYPGAPPEAQEGLQVMDAEVEVEESDEKPKSIWDWAKHPSLEAWVEERCSNGQLPKHRAGLDPDDLFKVRRTKSYLNKVLNTASGAVESDVDGAVNVDVVCPMLTKIEEAIDRLADLESDLDGKKKSKRKKKATLDSDLVKEGQKATHVGGIIVTVPLLISRVARVCINGVVSAGHDIEDLFEKQAKMYDLSEREKAEAMQLLSDMGYPLRRDRGYLIDDKVDSTSSNNLDWAANYKA